MPSEEDKSTEQKVAESEVESFRKDLGPFVVAAETTRMAMVFTDAKESNHPLIFSNDSLSKRAAWQKTKTLRRRPVRAARPTSMSRKRDRTRNQTQVLFQTIHPTGTVRSYVRPVSAVLDRWPR